MELKMSWLPWQKKRARQREFRNEKEFRGALVVLASESSRNFGITLLYTMVQKGLIEREQAAQIFRDTAELMANNEHLGPLADVASADWDKEAVFFEPREPGPPPPGHSPVPDFK